MIRINLLGQLRPKAARRTAAVDTGAAMPVVFIGAGAALGIVVLFLLYLSWQKQLASENQHIKVLQVQKADLMQIKQQVDTFEAQKKILTQRVQTIEQLQRDRTGGQELLDQIASTVSRTENLWLTTMTRKGNALAIEGSSASINSVANFITALKRSGYFQKVEIKETKQDDKNTGIQTFLFQLNAEVSPPQAPQAGAPAAGQRPQPKATNAPTQPTAAAKKG
jgi:type IV pilus assembly protein PilN